MMKIDKIQLLILRNDAHFQFHTEFRDLVMKHGAEALKVKPQFQAYLPLYDREDEALKKIVKSEFTAKIHEADKARDDIYTGMAEMNAAALKHFSPQTREAAGRLKIVFDTYGNVAGKPLNTIIAKYAAALHHHRHRKTSEPRFPEFTDFQDLQTNVRDMQTETSAPRFTTKQFSHSHPTKGEHNV
jgi:hypothetical protein